MKAFLLFLILPSLMLSLLLGLVGLVIWIFPYDNTEKHAGAIFCTKTKQPFSWIEVETCHVNK